LANITASMVKELREKTGAGMMDCKTALTETNGDMEAAVDWLRKKASPRPPKRPAALQPRPHRRLHGPAERLHRRGQSETDFVARNESLPGPGQDDRRCRAHVGGDVEKILAAKAGSMTIAEAIASAIATIGENMTLRRPPAVVGQGVVADLCAQPDLRRSRQDRACWSRSSRPASQELAVVGRRSRAIASRESSAIDASVSIRRDQAREGHPGRQIPPAGQAGGD